MSNYTATLIKSGNSYALRVPKQYVIDSKLKLGDKATLPLPTPQKKQDNAKLIQILEELQELHRQNPDVGLGSIKDPVAWQREIRKDRPLPGRD